MQLEEAETNRVGFDGRIDAQERCTYRRRLSSEHHVWARCISRRGACMGEEKSRTAMHAYKERGAYKAGERGAYKAGGVDVQCHGML